MSLAQCFVVYSLTNRASLTGCNEGGHFTDRSLCVCS